MIPTPGRIVAYKLTSYDAEAINIERRAENTSRFGNSVAAGDIYPLVITRVWSQLPGGAVNGQVLLDGNDSIWVTSRTLMADEETSDPAMGYWAPFPRVEG